LQWLGFGHWPELFRPPLDEAVFGKQSLGTGLPILIAIIVAADVLVTSLTAWLFAR